MNAGPVHFGLADAGKPNSVALTPEVERLLAKDCVVAISISSGKDSDAVAIATVRYLKQIGHKGPVVLCHAHLGRVEWKASLSGCQRLAQHLGIELMVVERKAGDMLARWQGRWANNVERFNDLSCVRLIMPWSSPALRFCTSELKTDQISAALKKRFPGQDILNVTGIRWQESSARAKMPISSSMAKLTRKGSIGVTWNAIIDWPIEDVLFAIRDSGLELHEAYTKYSAARVSCVYCIFSTQRDLRAAAGCEDNHDIYRLMVELEADSTFAFQGNAWLADVDPSLLSTSLRARVEKSKLAAIERKAVEAELPKHLLFTAGWPTVMPTPAEAELIASVRRRVANIVGLEAGYVTAASVLARYTDLMNQHEQKQDTESCSDVYAPATAPPA